MLTVTTGRYILLILRYWRIGDEKNMAKAAITMTAITIRTQIHPDMAAPLQGSGGWFPPDMPCDTTHGTSGRGDAVYGVSGRGGDLLVGLGRSPGS